MNNVWGDSAADDEAPLDEFRIQNELAHTMSTILQPARYDAYSDSNPFQDDEDESAPENDNEEPENATEAANSIADDSAWAQSRLEAQKTHLMSTLTQSGSDGFLKSPESTDIDDVLGADGAVDTPVDDLLQLATPAGEMRESIRTVASPNRKLQMFRPRRFQASGETVVDPLSGPPIEPTNSDSVLDSPGTKKSKLLSSIEAPLFNIDKNKVLNSVKDAPVAADETSEPVGVAATPAYKFDIFVGDPMTVGDFPNTHTIYSLTTRTDSPNFDHSETVVTRRYKDFLWLYRKLMNNNPGYIIPPPPEKQMVNRFDSKFIENRRIALEGMLQHVAGRGELQNDVAFTTFLQSNDFVADSAAMEDGAPMGLKDTNFEVNTMADMMNSMAIVGETPSAGSGGGFFSSLIGGLQTPKYVEHDEFILAKQEYVSQLDEQLRQLSRSLDMILEKRDELQVSLEELVVVIGQMSDLEVNADITLIMTNFEQLQSKMREQLERSNLSQVLTFGTVIDEYVRILGSIRNCFENRCKTYENVVTLEQTLEKKQRNVEKLRAKASDKMEAAQAEVLRVQSLLEKQRSFQSRFNTHFKQDLARFELEKVRDMKNMVEIYWEGLIENQKHVIELWEAFYEKCNFSSITS